MEQTARKQRSSESRNIFRCQFDDSGRYSAMFGQLQIELPDRKVIHANLDDANRI